jgi:hypothetical protein
MAVARANPPAWLQSPTLFHNVERWGQACPASDLVHFPQSLTLFIFYNFEHVYIY